MKRLMMICAFIGAASCVADEPMTVEPLGSVPNSGTRLAATYYQADDGAEQWTGSWYDSALSAPCKFQLAADGLVRCLPDSTPFAPTWFIDAQCSQQVVMLPVGCEAPPVALITSGCGGALEVQSVDPFETSSGLYRRNGNFCTPTLNPSASTQRPHQLLGAVPPGAYVAASYVVAAEEGQ